MTTETLMTDGQNTQVADSQQAATTQTEGQQAAAGDQATQQQQQATEGQTTEGQKAEGDNTEGDQGNTEQKTGAPEKYEFAAPEGKSFDEAVIGVFSEVAKELNLPQEAAQKVLDKMSAVMDSRYQEKLEVIWKEVGGAPETWAGSAKADKEFGGDKLEENLAIAKAGRDSFKSPVLNALLELTGYGNHPEILKVFYRAGKAISEDKVVGGKATQPGASDARSLYPNSNLK